MQRTWIVSLIAVAALAAAAAVGPVVFGQPEAPPPLITAPALPPPVKPAASPPAGQGVRIVAGTGADTSVPAVAPALAAGVVAPAPASTGRQEPAVGIEWVGPQTARVNKPMACQVIVRNAGSVAVENVVVRYQPGSGVECKSTERAVAGLAGELTWTLGTLPPGQSRRIDLRLTTRTRGPLNCKADVSFTATSSHQVMVREPKLAVKVQAPARAVQGEPIALRFDVSNPGDGAAELVKIRATLPEGLEHSSRSRSVDLEIGTLSPGESRPLQLTCLARGTGAQKIAVVVTGDGDLRANGESALEVLLPRLDVALNGPKLRYIDRHAIYTTKVSNPGPVAAPGVALREVVPTGFRFHSANGGGKFDPAQRTVTWTLGDLAPGQSREVAVNLVPTAPGEHRVAAQVTSARGQKGEAAAQTQVEGLSALQVELADVDDPVEVGAETAYEVRVTNTGTKQETNVELTCSLPEEVELKAARCGAELRYRIEGRQIIFEPLPRLAPKADVIYRIQVRGRAAGDVRFRTRVRADGLREPVLREESTRIYRDDAPLRTATPPESR